MRRTLLAACALAAPLLPAAALAEGKPLPPPASAVMPPVELTISMQDGKPVCAPQEIRLPADTNVALHVVSSADTPVTLTMPGQFANGRVLHADGDLVHVASEDGYLVKQNGKGTLRLRTLGPGQESYACTSTRDRKAPFTGTFVRTPPAG